MDDAGTSEVDKPVAETHGDSCLGQPSTAPDPASKNRIENACEEHVAEQETSKGNSFADGTDQGAGGCKQKPKGERGNGQVAASSTAKEEVAAADDAPATVTDQKTSRRRRSSRRRATEPPELDGVADQIVGEDSKDVRRKGQHHQVCRVFPLHEPAGQQTKPRKNQERKGCVDKAQGAGSVDGCREGHAQISSSPSLGSISADLPGLGSRDPGRRGVRHYTAAIWRSARERTLSARA